MKLEQLELDLNMEIVDDSNEFYLTQLEFEFNIETEYNEETL